MKKLTVLAVFLMTVPSSQSFAMSADTAKKIIRVALISTCGVSEENYDSETSFEQACGEIRAFAAINTAFSWIGARGVSVSGKVDVSESITPRQLYQHLVDNSSPGLVFTE